MLKLTDDVDVKAYEAYITEKALIYSFNPYIMLKGQKLSYSEKIHTLKRFLKLLRITQS
jgi:hypothetical protein